MTATFRLAQEDLKALQRVVQRRIWSISRANSRMFLFNLVAWVPIGIFLAASAALYRQNPGLAGDLKFIFGALAVGSAAVVAGQLYWRRCLGRSLAATDSWFFQNQQIELTPEGISQKAAYGESFYRWSAFTSVVEDSDRLFLFLDNAQALVLPKSVVGSQEAVEELKAQVSVSARSW